MTKNITKDLTVPYGNGFTMQAEELNCMKALKEVCTEFGITRKTLFYYDKIGLLKPTQRIGSQNTKYYSEKKCKQLKEIIAYKEAGVPLKTIQILLKETPEKKILFLEENIKTLQTNILSQQTKIQKTKELIQKLKEKQK